MTLLRFFLEPAGDGPPPPEGGMDTGGGGMDTEGAANTFNNKERVYSRAIAFSHRRCSVPLESMLPTS